MKLTVLLAIVSTSQALNTVGKSKLQLAQKQKASYSIISPIPPAPTLSQSLDGEYVDSALNKHTDPWKDNDNVEP